MFLPVCMAAQQLHVFIYSDDTEDSDKYNRHR